MEEDRIPATLLTGFLGSGKTTLLNAWLKSPELANAAVIVNEFGDVGIDHALIASSSDNTIQLSTGCLCCTVRGDLVETIRELTLKRSSGEIRPFDSIVIETTGLADPGPIIQALMTAPVARRYRFRQAITAVDAVQGLSTLDRYAEARKQVAIADDIVVTKTDMGSGISDELKSRLRALNPAARLRLSALNDAPTPSEFYRGDVYDPATKNNEVLGWLNIEAYTRNSHSSGHDHGNEKRHSEDIGSFCLEYDQALEWEHVANWLDALVMAHGDDLLRVKGILNIVGQSRPIVVQAVQRLFHPPHVLADWPTPSRKSQIVFITRGLSQAFVSEVFDTIRARPASSRTVAG